MLEKRPQRRLADGDAPGAARQVLQHEHGERPDGEAVPEDEGREVRPVELSRVLERADDGDGEREHHEQR